MFSLPGQHFLGETIVVAAARALAQTVVDTPHFQQLLPFGGDLVKVLTNLGVFLRVLQLLMSNQRSKSYVLIILVLVQSLKWSVNVNI